MNDVQDNKVIASYRSQLHMTHAPSCWRHPPYDLWLVTSTSSPQSLFIRGLLSRFLWLKCWSKSNCERPGWTSSAVVILQSARFRPFVCLLCSTFTCLHCSRFLRAAVTLNFNALVCTTEEILVIGGQGRL